MTKTERVIQAARNVANPKADLRQILDDMDELKESLTAYDQEQSESKPKGKTKGEILDGILYGTNRGFNAVQVNPTKNLIYEAMQAYADQFNKDAEISSLKDEIERLKGEINMVNEKLKQSLNSSLQSSNRISAYDLNEVGGIRKLKNRRNP